MWPHQPSVGEVWVHEMTGALEMCWTASHFLFSYKRTSKNTPLSFFCLVCFSVHNCLTMLSYFRDTQIKQAFRPLQSFICTEKQEAHFCQTILTCSAPTRLCSMDRWNDECRLPRRLPRVQRVCLCLSVALKATQSPCWVNATAGLEQIKKSVFMQRKCGK